LSALRTKFSTRDRTSLHDSTLLFNASLLMLYRRHLVFPLGANAPDNL